MSVYFESLLNVLVSFFLNHVVIECFCLEHLWLFFSFFILVFALLSVTSGNPVFCVLFLVLSFFFSSLFLICLGVDFIGLMLMVVYVGAIAVLFLFVVMMLNINEEPTTFPLLFLLCLIVKVFFFIYLNLCFSPLGNFFAYKNWFHIDQFDCLSCVGYTLYSDFIVDFIGISVALLVAMVGAIALNFRSEKGLRNQELLFQSSRSTEKALFTPFTSF